MNEQSMNNKNAWEYRAYEFWHKSDGSPMEKEKRLDSLWWTIEERVVQQRGGTLKRRSDIT